MNARRPKSYSVACETCLAGAGEPCTVPAWPTPRRAHYTHAPRRHAVAAEATSAEAAIRRVELLKVWTNEDGKRFVFADDLFDALYPDAPVSVAGQVSGRVLTPGAAVRPRPPLHRDSNRKAQQ